MTLNVWLAIAAICALGAMTPGPSLGVVIRHTLHHSREAGLVCAFAHAFAILIYASMSVAGLSMVFQSMPSLRNLIATMGALYLLFLAWQAWSVSGPAEYGEGQHAGDETLLAAARDGFLIVFLNPKVAIFFLAVFSQFISMEFTLYEKFLLALTAAVIDGLWYATVAAGLSHSFFLGVLRRNAVALQRTIAVLYVGVALAVLLTVLTETY